MDLNAVTQTGDAIAAIVHAPGGRFALQRVRVGDLRDDEVLVEIVASGVCHTDLAVRDQRRAVPLPAILGHEGAGIVRRVGSAVTSVSPSDHVVLSYLSCGACEECVAERTACCAEFGRLCFASARPDGTHAVSGADGEVLSDRFFGQSSFATWAVANERNVVVAPDDLPLELLAPLGCGVMTGAGAVWNALSVTPGSSIAVFGAGSVGLSAVLAARAVDAKIIIAVDRVASRLALARELGATHVIDTTEVEDAAAAVRALIGDGVDKALDTTGAPFVVRDAFRSLRQRGVLAIAATASPTQELAVPQLELMTGCKTIIGVIEGGSNARTMIARILELYRAGRFPFDRLLSFYRFEDINQAIEDCEAGRAIKPVLRMNSFDAAGVRQ